MIIAILLLLHYGGRGGYVWSGTLGYEDQVGTPVCFVPLRSMVALPFWSYRLFCGGNSADLICGSYLVVLLSIDVLYDSFGIIIGAKRISISRINLLV